MLHGLWLTHSGSTELHLQFSSFESRVGEFLLCYEIDAFMPNHLKLPLN